MPAKKEETKVKEAKVESKAAEKAVKASKVEAKEVAVEKPAAKKTSLFSVTAYSLAGKEVGTLDLPKEVFGKEINKNFLAQAMRVYMTNKKEFTGSTKTRGEVEGSTAKIYRQKGTGRARHGSIMAPIFVGGGIVFGPKPRKVKLEMPKKMKKAALHQALSMKAMEQGIAGVSGLEKATGKTKEIAVLAKSLNVKSTLIVTGEKMDNVVRGAKNIQGVDVISTNLLNAYEVLRHQIVLLTKESVDILNSKKEVKE